MLLAVVAGSLWHWYASQPVIIVTAIQVGPEGDLPQQVMNLRRVEEFGITHT